VVRLRGGLPAVQPEQLEAITTAGHPVYEIELGDKYDLGAEFFRWEFATAVAASLLEVNPLTNPKPSRPGKPQPACSRAIGRRASFPAPSARWIRPMQPS